MPSDPTDPLKLLSVVGAGRSGTTILAGILGEVPGFSSAGELRWLWERGVVDSRPCGCGQPPTDCEVWAPVIDESVKGLPPGGGPGRDDGAVAGLISAQHEVAHWKNLPRALGLLDGRPGAWEALDVVRHAMSSAAKAFAEATHARVVVDTSKRPIDAAVLAGGAGIDPYVLHIVRDPRAVVHSWRRSKSFDAAGTTRSIGTRRLLPTVRRWIWSCLSAEALRRHVPPSKWLSIRYEDLATRPRQVTEAILEFLGESGPAPFVDEHTVTLHDNHIVAGNPSRFTVGKVAIRPDDAWRRDMPERDQRLVFALTYPLLRRYGYARTRTASRQDESVPQ